MAEQDFSEIARLAERYSKEPKSRIFVQLADAYRKNNMVDEALEVLKQGLQYHPNYPLAHLILGKCYFDKRMYAQAREALEKTIEFDPINIVALRMLAQVCETLKDDAGQIMAYKSIVSIDPADEMARSKLQALEAAQKKGQVVTIALAQEYEKQGNFEEALKVYEQLGFMDPTDLVIKQKIKELRSKISRGVEELKKEEETQVAGLKLESYFQPEEINVSAPVVEVPKPPDTTLGEHIIDLEQEIKPPVVEETKPEPLVEAKETEKVEEPVEVLSIEELLVEPSEVIEEVKPESIVEEPVPPTITPETPKEEIPSPINREGSVELPEVEEQVSRIEPETKPEPVEDIAVKEKIEQPVETQIPSEPFKDIIAEQPVERIQEPEISEAAEKPVAEKPTVTEPVVKESAEEKPTAPSEEGKKEEPQKPKEEDFKSFQDWLSSLLK
ncbi:MAG: tetratricopeptide repeat protein [bacterium]